ncbi:unnamed protein product, partial [Staurois parvus]
MVMLPHCCYVSTCRARVVGETKLKWVGGRGGLTIWKLGHCPRAWGQ